MKDVTRGDIQELFNTKADYSRAIAEQVKTIMNVSFHYAVTIKVISVSPVEGIGLPKIEKTQQKSGFRTRNIDTQKTLTMEQIWFCWRKAEILRFICRYSLEFLWDFADPKSMA